MAPTERRSLAEKRKITVTAEQDEFQDHKFPFCLLHPNGRIKSVWNIVLAILLLYTATVMPWRMAFIDTKMWDDWFIFELCIDGLFFIDFLVNCFSAYYDYEGVLVTDRKKIL
jgi:hypothetical protein